MSNKSMGNENVSDLELRKYFLEYYQKLKKTATKHPEFKLDQNNYHLLSKDAKEASQMLNYMSKIDGLLADLEKTAVFIRRFPLKEYYQKNDIDQLDYIKYHFEVFIHKIHTLLEVKKLWLNEFYEIGLDERDCNWNNLKNYKKIQKSPAKIIIDNYYKSFESLIKLRHLNTHRAYFQDSKNEELKSELMIYNLYEKFGLELDEEYKRMSPKFLIDYQVKKYRKERVGYIKNGIEVATIYSNQFITLILTEFFNEKINKRNSRKSTSER
ncbi:MAG TPA: hypothetical protein VK050_06585 [Flavobacteriaceae bacterium]|nr:hypothetical protein [Flavobacteriaceae bacterium]